mgnify:CR=1 FL=1
MQGVGNLLVQLAKCCQPVAGEPIVGYLTRGRGVTVHRRDCAALRRLAAQHPQRVLPVEWGQAGSGYELDAIAAVVIGGASLAGGSGRATGTLIGAILLAVIRNGLNILNVSSFWQQVVIGCVIALAVGFDVFRRKTDS